jgi:SSS family solute:Na+ symporter
MVILYLAIVATVILAIYLVGGIGETFSAFSSARTKAVDFTSTGFDGKDFAFWPMLFGGLFLYISYYGCDQTQVQRELSTKDTDDTNLSLFINGTLRFPLVLTYCLLGICIGAYVAKHPEFLGLLPKGESGNPNYNVAVPVFVIKYFPVGMVGLFMVGLFSAAMSSLDSTINSLSATTMEDILKGLFRWEMKQRQELLASKALTVFWGVVCVVFAFFVGGISDSIIVSINKIGSLANGPILAVFTLGVLTKRADGVGAVSGLVLGFVFNLALWKYAPEVSWLWWNVTGFLVAFVIGWGLSLVKPNKKETAGLVWHRHNEKELGLKKNWVPYYWILGGTALMILAVLSLIGIK